MVENKNHILSQESIHYLNHVLSQESIYKYMYDPNKSVV